jgi:hypothetical protein
VSGKRGKEPASRGGQGTAPTQHNEIDTLQTVAALTKAFARHAFQAVTINGSARTFFRHRQSQARLMTTIEPTENREAGVYRPRGLDENVTKFPCFP